MSVWKALETRRKSVNAKSASIIEFVIMFVAVMAAVIGTLMMITGCSGGGEPKPWFHLDCYVQDGVILVDAETCRSITTLTCEELDVQEIFTEDSTFEFPASPGTYTFVVEYERILPAPRHEPLDMGWGSSPSNVCIVEVPEPEVEDDYPPPPGMPCWETNPPNRWGHRKVAVCKDGRTRCLPVPAACNLTQEGKARWGTCEEEEEN
jgi:hypothetical protein